MITREFKWIDEIEKYYDEKSNTYVFKEGDKYIDLVIINFELYVDANIDACNLEVMDVEARDIDVMDLDALKVKADNIHAHTIKAYKIECDNLIYRSKYSDIKHIVCKSINDRDGLVKGEQNEK